MRRLIDSYGPLTLGFVVEAELMMMSGHGIVTREMTHSTVEFASKETMILRVKKCKVKKRRDDRPQLGLECFKQNHQH